MAVAVVESGEVLAVDVEHCYDIVAVIDRDHYFATRGGAAGDVAGKCLHIGDYKGVALLPSCATDAATKGYVHTGYGALKGT